MAFADHMGLSREEIVGKTAYELASEQLAEEYVRSDEELFQNPGVQVYETSEMGIDGKMRDLEYHKATFNDAGGKPAGLIGVIMDLTDRKSMERQLRKAQRMESIATLAGGIAHDFNNLLTIISGYAEIGLVDKTQSDPGYDELSIVLAAAERGADLVKQILTFSRDVETNPKPVDLNRQVLEAQRLLYNTIPKMIHIHMRLADDLKVVTADPTQIEQILLNLGVNARDAMPEGGKLIFQTANCVLDESFCSRYPEMSPGEYVALTISDTGVGMERDVLDRIFEPFFSTKKTGEGTGLGLAMVFGIIKKHGGHITCRSEPGIGTTFKMYFPVAKEENNDEDASKSGEQFAMGSETILLVDDEELICDLGKRILARHGYRVITASNGKEALRIYQKRKNEIKLVILDMIMPVMGGNECLSELLKIDPKTKVLISTGYFSNVAPTESIKTGTRGSVRKPFNIKDLLQSVRRALDED